MSYRPRRRPPALSITAPDSSSSIIFPPLSAPSQVWSTGEEEDNVPLPSFSVADTYSLFEKAAAIERMTSRAHTLSTTSSTAPTSNRDSLFSPIQTQSSKSSKQSKERSRTLDALGSFGKKMVKEVLGGRGNNMPDRSTSQGTDRPAVYGRGGAGRSLSTSKSTSAKKTSAPNGSSSKSKLDNNLNSAGPSSSIPGFTRSSVIFPPSPLRSSNSLPSDSLEQQQQSHFTSALPSPAPSLRGLRASSTSTTSFPDDANTRIISPLLSPVLPPTPSSAVDIGGAINGDIAPNSTGRLSAQHPLPRPKRSSGSATPTPTAFTARVPSSTEVPPLPTAIHCVPSVPTVAPVHPEDSEKTGEDGSSVQPQSRMESWVNDQRRRRRIRRRRLGTANSNTSASTNGFGTGRSTSLSMQSRDDEDDETDDNDSDMAEAGSNYEDDGGVSRREVMRQLDIEGEEIERKRKELGTLVGSELGLLPGDGEDGLPRLQVDMDAEVDADADAGGESPAVKVESLLRQPSIAVSSSVSVRQWKRYFEQYSREHPVPSIPNNWRTSTGSILLPQQAQSQGRRRNRNSMTSLKTPTSSGGAPWNSARSRRSSVALGPGIGAQQPRTNDTGLGLNLEGASGQDLSTSGRWCPCNDPMCAINTETSGSSSKRRTPPVSTRRAPRSSVSPTGERTLPTIGPPLSQTVPQPVAQPSGFSPSASASGSASQLHSLPAGTGTATSSLLPQLLSLMSNAVATSSGVPTGDGQPMVSLSAALNLVAALLPLAAQMQLPAIGNDQQLYLGEGLMLPPASSSSLPSMASTSPLPPPRSDAAPANTDVSNPLVRNEGENSARMWRQPPSAAGTYLSPSHSHPRQLPSPHDLRTPSEIEGVSPRIFNLPEEDLNAGDEDIPFSPMASTNVSRASAPALRLASAFSSSSSSGSSGVDVHSWANEPSPVSRGEPLPYSLGLPMLPPVGGIEMDGLGILMSEFGMNRSTEAVRGTDTDSGSFTNIVERTTRDIEVEVGESEASGSVRSAGRGQVVGGMAKRRLAPKGPRPRVTEKKML